jgi:hypothetical protein
METAQIRFGQPEEWQAFQKRHPKFVQSLRYLHETTTKIFIREMTSSGSSGPADRVVFYLGRLAVEDFNEILLLCGNGFGIGAMKLLRGLFERVVTLLYISEHPDKVEDFLDYFHIHMGKFLNHAKDVFSLNELNLSAEEASEILEHYEKAKDKYKIDVCKQCGTTRIMNSWSELDTLSMAHKTGIKNLYLPCFYDPTLQIHSTGVSLCSRLKPRADGGLTFIDGPQHKKADSSLNCAHTLILCVLDAVNDYFKMGLQEEIKKRIEDFKLIWVGMEKQLSTNKPT